MIGKVKKWLGIEGVKILFDLEDEWTSKDQVIRGEIHLLSMRDEKISRIAIRIKEQYKRGRGKDKKISEFVLGEKLMEGPFYVKPGEPTVVSFELPYELMQSSMDELEDRNLVLKGLVGAAKWAKGVQSLYWVEAEARVKGTVLDAFAKKFITLR